ncbi:MAG: hypothetical protein WDW38_008779 [Sanguina aurantia]
MCQCELHSMARDMYGGVWAWGCGVNGQVGSGGREDRSPPVRVLGPAIDSSHRPLTRHSHTPTSHHLPGPEPSNAPSGSYARARTDARGPAPVDPPSAQAAGVHADCAAVLPGVSSADSESPGSKPQESSCCAGGAGVGRPGACERQGLQDGVKFRQVSCGARHSMAVDTAGRVWAWGWGAHGQCGHRDQEDVLSPRVVAALGGLNMVAAAGGLGHTLALSDTGDVYAWGWNDSGQLGLGHTQSANAPQLVEALTDTVIKVSCGGRHSIALTETRFSSGVSCDGTAPVAGSHHGGGVREQEMKDAGCDEPVSMSDPMALHPDHTPDQGHNSLETPSNVGGSPHHSVTPDTQLQRCVYVWGGNACGQLGMGDTLPRLIPTLVMLPGSSTSGSGGSRGSSGSSSGGSSGSSSSGVGIKRGREGQAAAACADLAAVPMPEPACTPTSPWISFACEGMAGGERTGAYDWGAGPGMVLDVEGGWSHTLVLVLVQRSEPE